MGEGRKVKLSERTADRLCELIMDERQFTPGSKLPNENELSEACLLYTSDAADE